MLDGEKIEAERRAERLTKSSPNTFISTTTSLENIRFRLFPSGTRLVGPVVVIQRAKALGQYNKPTVLLSLKLLFPDGSEVVIAAQTRTLWAGNGEAAFDVARETQWKVAAASRGGIIINHGGGHLGAQA